MEWRIAHAGLGRPAPGADPDMTRMVWIVILIAADQLRQSFATGGR
jgi:hypothetical protein